MANALSWISIVGGILAAGIGGYAAFGIDIRDNLDSFIQDLQRQSQFASWAALAAGISAVAQALEKFLR
jgi:hypothetical protein